MKYIELGINLTDDLALKSIVICQNNTEMANDSHLIEQVALGLIRVLHANRDSIDLQDILNEAGIKLSNK